VERRRTRLIGEERKIPDEEIAMCQPQSSPEGTDRGGGEHSWLKLSGKKPVETGERGGKRKKKSSLTSREDFDSTRKKRRLLLPSLQKTIPAKERKKTLRRGRDLVPLLVGGV